MFSLNYECYFKLMNIIIVSYTNISYRNKKSAINKLLHFFIYVLFLKILSKYRAEFGYLNFEKKSKSIDNFMNISKLNIN